MLWIVGGNSKKQDEAREMARLALARAKVALKADTKREMNQPLTNEQHITVLKLTEQVMYGCSGKGCKSQIMGEKTSLGNPPWFCEDCKKRMTEGVVPPGEHRENLAATILGGMLAHPSVTPGLDGILVNRAIECVDRLQDKLNEKQD